MTTATVKYKWLLIGSGYRFGDAVLAMVGTEFKGFRISCSYDSTVSKLANATGGGIEFSLRCLIK
jgi:hypothetical protein